MMTPQEVAGCTFTKAVMGGYNMASVDDFLDKITEDYAALYKENAELTGKIQTLASKLEEYREIEDAMRSTLLTAQRMASNMVAEAEKKRDELLANAPQAAKERMEEIQRQVDAEEQRLADRRREVDEALALEEERLALGQEKLRDFIATVQAACQSQLALLEELPELPIREAPIPEPEPAAQEEPQEPEAQDVQEAQEPQEEPLDAETAEIEKNIQDVIAAFAKEASPAQPQEPEPPAKPQEDIFGSNDLEATRVLNLDDLQFGRNYNME